MLGLTLLSGCGGGLPRSSSGSGSGSGGSGSGGSGSGGNGSGNAGTAVLVSLGEFATVPDQTVSFEITIDSVTLHSSNGDVSLLSTPRRVELSRFKAEPLWLGNPPPGNYSGIVIGVSNPEISFIDSSGVLQENVAASLTSSSATNASEFTLGSTPGEIRLVLSFFNTSFDGGGVMVTPSFGFGIQGETPIEDLVGRIINAGGGSFTMDAGNGAFNFATDSGTEFQDFTALSELSAGMTVEVSTVPGVGTLRAAKVKLESDDANEVVIEGPALSLPPAQIQILAREIHGPEIQVVAMPNVGTRFFVDANASTQFHIDSDDVDLNNLDFTPTFDALTIALGQNVRAALNPEGSFFPPADQLKLEEQSIVGTAGSVSAGSVSGQFSFPLNFAPDSAFTQLTGHTSLLVTLQPSAQKYLYFGFEDCVTCITGGTVRVRGLLFFSGGQYHLVANWLVVDD